MNSISPEFRLLLAAIRARVDSTTTEVDKGRDLESVDWTRLVDLSQLHRLTPLLHQYFSTHPTHHMPEDQKNRVRDMVLRNTARNTRMIQELFSILDVFREKSIPILSFKGPTMAASFYGDTALRQFDDLDFLVRPEDMSRARDAFGSMGYSTHVHLTAAQEKAHVRAGWEYIFRRNNEEYTVELDTGIVPRYFSFHLEPERLFQNNMDVVVDGRPVPTLSPDHLLLFLCVHGTKHLWSRLSWIADISLLIKAQPEMDWGLLLEDTRRHGALRMLLLGLKLAKDHGHAALPEEVMKEIAQDNAIEELSGQAEHHLFRTAHIDPGKLEEINFHLRTRERLRDRLRYCLILGLSPSFSDWKSMPLPGPLFPLYYLTRPVRLGWKGVKMGWKGLRPGGTPVRQ